MPTDLSYKENFPSTHLWLWMGIPLILILLTQLLGFNGLYGQDSHEYLRFSRYLQEVFAGVEQAPTFFYPIGYPLFGSLLGYVFSNVIALQLLSMLSW